MSYHGKRKGILKKSDDQPNFRFKKLGWVLTGPYLAEWPHVPKITFCGGRGVVVNDKTSIFLYSSQLHDHDDSIKIDKCKTDSLIFLHLIYFM